MVQNSFVAASIQSSETTPPVAVNGLVASSRQWGGGRTNVPSDTPPLFIRGATAACWTAPAAFTLSAPISYPPLEMGVAVEAAAFVGAATTTVRGVENATFRADIATTEEFPSGAVDVTFRPSAGGGGGDGALTCAAIQTKGVPQRVAVAHTIVRSISGALIVFNPLERRDFVALVTFQDQFDRPLVRGMRGSDFDILNDGATCAGKDDLVATSFVCALPPDLAQVTFRIGGVVASVGSPPSVSIFIVTIIPALLGTAVVVGGVILAARRIQRRLAEKKKALTKQLLANFVDLRLDEATPLEEVGGGCKSDYLFYYYLQK